MDTTFFALANLAMPHSFGGGKLFSLVRKD
jgi:hypothetical protein